MENFSFIEFLKSMDFSALITAIATAVLAWYGYTQTKIAKQQKDIALLDKRLSLMNEFSKTMSENRSYMLTVHENLDWGMDLWLKMNEYEKSTVILFSKDIADEIISLDELISSRQNLVDDISEKCASECKNVYAVPEVLNNYNDIYRKSNTIIEKMQNFIKERNFE